VICNLVNDVRFVQIDGFVQRIPAHDIKVILRGTTDHIDVVTAEITSLFAHADENCQIETVRKISISRLPPNPSFKILNSASRYAIKSDKSPEEYDNHSSKSSHASKESSLRSKEDPSLPLEEQSCSMGVEPLDARDDKEISHCLTRGGELV
jgi:hypothetical protein